MMDLEGRTRGLLRLLVHWITRNPDWDAKVVDWTKTPEGQSFLDELLAVGCTSYYVGKATGGLTAIAGMRELINPAK